LHGRSAQEEDAVQDFRNLLVWRKAHRLTLDVYAVFSKPKPWPQQVVRYQLLRSAASIPANLAEGCGRTGDPEFRRFVRIALGSAAETEYHLLLARDLGLLPEPTYETLAESAVEIKRMLTGLAASLGRRKTDGETEAGS